MVRVKPPNSPELVAQHFEGLCYKSFALKFSRDLGLPNRIAESVLRMRISMLVNMGSVDKVDFAMISYR